MTRLDTDSFIAPLLSRGLSANEAQQIVDHAVTRGRLDHQAKCRLAKISECYASSFTTAGAEAWKKLTGIDVGGGKVSYPEGFLPRQTILELRAGTTHKAQKTGSTRAIDRLRALGDSVAASAADLSWTAKVTPKVLRDLKLPSAFLLEYLGAVSESPALNDLYHEIADAEKNDGNNDGYLVRGDLDNASATVRGVMDRIYRQEGGDGRISLSRIRRRLPSAAVQFLNQAGVREDTQHQIYPRLAQEAVAWLADGYHREVIGAGESTSTFLRSRGMRDSRAAGRIRRMLPQLYAKPTEEQAAALWQMKSDGKISGVLFAETAQMSVAQGHALEKKRPELFSVNTPTTAAEPKSFFGSAATAAGDFLELINGYRQQDIMITRDAIIERANQNEAFVKKWGGMTTARYKTWQRNSGLPFPDLRSVSEWLPVLTAEVEAVLAKDPDLTIREVTAALKPRHPVLGEHHIETVSSGKPGLFQRTGRRSPERNAQAPIVAKLASKWADQDVLITRDDIIDRLNADKNFVAKWGEVTVDLYKNLNAKCDGWPKLRDRSVWMPVVLKEVEALLAENGELSYAQIAKLLEPKHPRINESTIGELAKVHKAEIHKYRKPQEKRPYAQVSRRIAKVLGKAPKTTYPQVAKQLEADYPWITPRLVSDMVNKYRATLFPQVRAARNLESDTARESLVVQGVYDLILRMFPPGTTQDVLMAALNRQLEQRGVPPFNSKVFQASRGSSLDVLAEVGSRVVAEYAAVAAEGTSENDILNAVADDYPGMTRMGMRHIRKRWTDDPKQFPALRPFVDRDTGELEFRGLGKGKTITNPRYVGGWDVERSVLGGGKKELGNLAGLVQHTRIPLHLPMLDAALDDLGRSTPFQSKNVLMVSHMLATTVPLALALKQAGAELPNTVMVGTPYGSNETVVGTMKKMGFDVRVPQLSVPDYRATVERALDDIAARYRENGQTIIVLDDGGLVADLLHDENGEIRDKYKDLIGAIKIVEQTTGGHIQNEAHALKVPVIDVPGSRSKKKEGRMVGKAVAFKVRTGLEGLGQNLTGKTAVVWGYGTVGREVARELGEAGVQVTVIETSEKRRQEAHLAGFATAEAASPYLGKADVLVGCTGERVMTVEDMRQLKSGAVFASASSKQNEFAMDDLADAAAGVRKIEPKTPTITLPTKEYQLDGKRIIALGDGWPVNFDGDVEDIAPGEIQLTRAIMFSAALQACHLQPTKKNVGLIKFDPGEDKKLLARYKEFQTSTAGAHPLRDPFAWKSVVRELADELGVLDTPEVARSRMRAMARFLEPKTREWFNTDPLMKTEDMVRCINDDQEFRARFGELTRGQYVNLRPHADLPDLRRGSAWKPIILGEVQELLAEDPTFLRKDLLRLLKPRHPNMRKHHIDTLGIEHPDVVPTARPELR